MFIRKIGLPILIYILFILGVSAQSPDINVTNLQDMSDILSEDFDHRWASISPDGSRIVWATWISETLLCQYHLETEIERCLDYRAEDFGSFIRSYTWSPDGRYIAFTETINDRGFDSDLWVYDLNEHEIINLTDDGIGQFYEEQPETMMWDVVPTWNPVNGDLYFFRIQIENDWDEVPFATYVSEKLYQISIFDSSIREVSDLSDDIIIGGTFQHSPIFNLEGSAAISSDGRYMIASNSPVRSDTEQSGGLWIFDLEGDDAPYMLVEWDSLFSNGAPDDYTGFAFTFSLSWVAEDEAVLLSFSNWDGEYPANLLYIPIEENPNIIPLVDFSDVTLDEMDNANPITGYSIEFSAPHYAVVLQDSFTILTWHREFRNASFGLITLPPNIDSELHFIESLENGALQLMADGRATISNNGFVFMGGILFEIEQ